MNPINNKEPKVVPHGTWVFKKFLELFTLSQSPLHILVNDEIPYLVETNYFSGFIPW